MIPDRRNNRTTKNPGLVDLAPPRRPAAEVAREKQQKEISAKAARKAQKVAADHVAELERQGKAATQKKKKATSIVGTKVARKQAATSEVEVQVTSLATPGSIASSDGAKKRKLTKDNKVVKPKNKNTKSITPAASKLRGFKNHLAPAPPVHEPTPEVEVSQEEDTDDSDEDELQYNGHVGDISLISIGSSQVVSESSDGQAVAYCVSDLPEDIRRQFSKEFVPAIIAKVRASTKPWRRLSTQAVQEVFDAVYPDIEHTITKDDAIENLANQRVMTFRNMIGKQGVHHVQAYLKMKKFDVHNTKEYVERAFNYHGEIPFLYQTFKVTDKVVNTQEEAGGYKVVRHGLFRHRAIIHTMMSYYQAIKSTICTAHMTGIDPVGALALVCAAVGRGLQMHKTGVYIPDSRPRTFSEKDWGSETAIYMKLISDMAPSRWESFYSAIQTAETIGEELEEFAESKPNRRGGHGPSSYHIQDSDPVEPGNEMEEME